MATHSSILAWEIPMDWEPGRLQFMGRPRVQHNLVITKKKKWIPAICDNMHGPWRYYAQWNRWRKTNSTWFHSYVESKKIEQTDQRKKLINTEIRLVVTRGEGMEGKMGKRGQLHSNGWKLDWCWWSLCSVYRCWIIMLYTWNLYNLKRNRKPKNSNLP